MVFQNGTQYISTCVWTQATLCDPCVRNCSISLYIAYTYILFHLPIEPVHENSNHVVFATSKASNQPAHKRSLIRAFASRLSILWMLSYWLNTIWSV